MRARPRGFAVADTVVKLPRSFYDRPTLEVARDLLGQVLVHRRGQTVTSGVIVEVEAYIGEADPACHAHCGPTRRNAPLYGPPGRAYVYLNYGIHSLVNAVTEREGRPSAVLIRALDPLDGVAVMRRRRRREARGVRPSSMPLTDDALCRGPGNLTRAMGITLSYNCADLGGDALFIEEGSGAEGRGEAVRRGAGAVSWGPRIGIRVGQDRPWRAWITGHPAVSAAGGRT